MPAFKPPPDSNVASDPRAASHQLRQPLLFRPHVYFALAILAVVLVVHFASRRLANSSCLWFGRPAQFRARQPESLKDPTSRGLDESSWAKATTINKPPSPFKHQGIEERPQAVWRPRLLRSPISSAGMEFPVAPGIGTDEKDQSGSRGVSSGATDLTQQRPPLSALGARLGRRGSGSPRSSQDPSSSRAHITNLDGPPNWRGNAMTDDGRQGVPQTAAVGDPWEIEQRVSGDNTTGAGGASDSSRDLGYATPRQFHRPPLPPPLTPPALSTAMFTFEDRHPSYAVSIPPQLDATFIHQPNPDYLASSTAAELGSSPKSATTTPRRRSYTKTVPIGVPSPSGLGSSPRSLDSSASTEAFSPSSYPPSSPRLPPPPPSHFDDFRYEPDGQPQEIGLQGEIISVMDDAGHGWKRHTRVYGGGVCLACMASGGQGGFYGDRVPPEDRR